MLSDLKFLVPLSVSVMVLNSVSIWLVNKTRGVRKKSTSRILISLLVSDMLIGAVVIPTRVIDVLLHQSAVFPYIYAYLLFVAAFNVFVLTWDRYTSIGRPLQWKFVGNGRISKILVAVWVVPAVISLMPLAWVHNSVSSSILPLIYRYLLVTILLVVILVVSIFQGLLVYELHCFWYGKRDKDAARLSAGAGNGSPRKRNGSLRKRVASLALIVGVSFGTIATWLPTIVLNFRPEFMTTWVAKLSLYSFFINSLVDPILVIAFNFEAYLVNTARNRRLAMKKRMKYIKETELQFAKRGAKKS
eukprot:gene5193-5848_t